MQARCKEEDIEVVDWSSISVYKKIAAQGIKMSSTADLMKHLDVHWNILQNSTAQMLSQSNKLG